MGLSAVVISVALLGWELNYSNRLAQATEEREILQLYNDLNLSIASDPEFGAFQATLASEDETELTATERERALAQAHLARNVWVAVERAYSLGIIPEARHQAALRDIRGIAESYPKLRPFMRTVTEAFQDVEYYELDTIIMAVTAE